MASDRLAVKGIYTAAYAEKYESLYLDSWSEKHQINQKFIEQILFNLPAGRWLDLGCGQAWHFSQVPCALSKVGVDLSPHQLRHAAKRNPDASFILGDWAEIEFLSASFDFVTCFWGAYCYLDDDDRILRGFRRVLSWIRPQGALYLEVLPPQNLESFNSSRYSDLTGFKVSSRTPDYRAWSYHDAGGTHLMRSLPLEAFVALFRPHFERVQWVPTGFMVNLVCRNRRTSTAG